MLFAIIRVQEKSSPIDLPINPEVSIICPPGFSLSSMKFGNGEIMLMMEMAKLTAVNLTPENARLAVVNYCVSHLGLRLIGPPAIIYLADQPPVFEYYMQMPEK